MKIKLKKLGYVSKEERLAATSYRKMDAISLQGIWTNFPEAVAAAAGRQRASYYLLLEDVKKRQKIQERLLDKKETNKSILDDLILRLEQEHLTNMVLFLAEV